MVTWTCTGTCTWIVCAVYCSVWNSKWTFSVWSSFYWQRYCSYSWTFPDCFCLWTLHCSRRSGCQAQNAWPSSILRAPQPMTCLSRKEKLSSSQKPQKWVSVVLHEPCDSLTFTKTLKKRLCHWTPCLTLLRVSFLPDIKNSPPQRNVFVVRFAWLIRILKYSPSLCLVKQDRNWYRARNERGQEGMIPANYVQKREGVKRQTMP